MEKKLGVVALLMDDKISREKAQLVTRTINALRHYAQVVLLRSDSSESEIVSRLEQVPANLCLLPWHRYLESPRVEALFGLTRTRGPTVAGYFADDLPASRLASLPRPSAGPRAILLDFHNLQSSETLSLLKAVAEDEARTGIRPLLKPDTAIYGEQWFSNQGLSLTTEAVLEIPEIAATEWARRTNTIRICLMALWSMIFEEGPGKGELGLAPSHAPKAGFQFGVDDRALMFRLCFTMNAWTGQDTLNAFWPGGSGTSSAMGLLLRYADVLRVHPIAGTQDLEIVAGLYPSSPSEKAPDQLHTLWIETIAQQIILEPPYAVPGPDVPYLRTLATVAPPPMDPKSKDRFIFNAAVKVRELKRAIDERDELIRELKSGGVGTAPPLPPPDAEGLLEAFQERYFEMRFQIRQLEVEVAQAESHGASPEQLESLRKRIQALMERQRGWVQKLSETLKTYRSLKTKEGA